MAANIKGGSDDDQVVSTRSGPDDRRDNLEPRVGAGRQIGVRRQVRRMPRRPGGNGDGPAGASLSPPAAPFAKALAGKSDAWIAKATKEGGPAVGLAPTMPPFGDLTDDQVKGLVAYMKSLK
jgi:cytochrome c1